MDLILGVVLMVFGLVTLIKKELRLSNARVSRGTPAVTAGALLVAALPIAYLAQIVLGVAASAGTAIMSEASRAILTYVILLVVTVIALAVAFRGAAQASS